jgi:hypothetical protein
MSKRYWYPRRQGKGVDKSLDDMEVGLGDLKKALDDDVKEKRESEAAHLEEMEEEDGEGEVERSRETMIPR